MDNKLEWSLALLLTVLTASVFLCGAVNGDRIATDQDTAAAKVLVEHGFNVKPEIWEWPVPTIYLESLSALMVKAKCLNTTLIYQVNMPYDFVIHTSDGFVYCYHIYARWVFP